MEAFVRLENVSVRFRRYQGRSSGLKEATMRWLSPPEWLKKHPPERAEFWALKGLNLEIREGDRIGILGRNGAGKSTLLKVISRIYRPTSGMFSVSGRVAPLIEIGAGFNPELSGRENIFLNSAILGIKRREIEKRIEAIVQFAELEEFIDMPVKYYSTGMHLKLAFTVATEVSPDILILDELYAGGDAAFIKKANSRLQEFVDRSKILILVSHSVEYISKFCNRAIVLDHGQLRLEGSPLEMIDRYTAFCAGNTTALSPPGNA